MISKLLQIYIYVVIANMIMSYLPQYREQQWARTLHKIADASQKPIRDLMPANLPIDPSGMIVIIICQILMYVLGGL